MQHYIVLWALNYEGEAKVHPNSIKPPFFFLSFHFHEASKAIERVRDAIQMNTLDNEKTPKIRENECLESERERMHENIGKKRIKNKARNKYAQDGRNNRK